MGKVERIRLSYWFWENAMNFYKAQRQHFMGNCSSMNSKGKLFCLLGSCKWNPASILPWPFRIVASLTGRRNGLTPRWVTVCKFGWFRFLRSVSNVPTLSWSLWRVTPSSSWGWRDTVRFRTVWIIWNWLVLIESLLQQVWVYFFECIIFGIRMICLQHHW